MFSLLFCLQEPIEEVQASDDEEAAAAEEEAHHDDDDDDDDGDDDGHGGGGGEEMLRENSSSDDDDGPPPPPPGIERQMLAPKAKEMPHGGANKARPKSSYDAPAPPPVSHRGGGFLEPETGPRHVMRRMQRHREGFWLNHPPASLRTGGDYPHVHDPVVCLGISL